MQAGMYWNLCIGENGFIFMPSLYYRKYQLEMLF